MSRSYANPSDFRHLPWNHQRVVSRGFLASNVAKPGILSFSKFYKKIEPRVDATMDHLASAAEIHFVLVGVLLAQTLIAKDHMHQLGTLQSWLRNPALCQHGFCGDRSTQYTPLPQTTWSAPREPCGPCGSGAQVDAAQYLELIGWDGGRLYTSRPWSSGMAPAVHLCTSTFFHPSRYNRCCQRSKEVKQCDSMTKREVWNRGWVYSLRTLTVTILF